MVVLPSTATFADSCSIWRADLHFQHRISQEISEKCTDALSGSFYWIIASLHHRS